MSAFRFILLGLILYLGVGALKIEFSVLQVGFLDVFDDFPFVILALLTTAVLFIDAHHFARNRKWYQFLSSALGGVFVVIILFGKIGRYATNTSPVVIAMEHIPGNHPAFDLELKENGCFKLYEANIFGRSIYYGEYKRIGNDSVHLVSYNHEDHKKLPRVGFLRGDTITWNDSIMMTIAREEKVTSGR